MIDTLASAFITARKKVIQHTFSHLNPAQREAVLTTNGPMLLLAGAGSGKTTVLINRIANLIKFGSGSDSTHVPEFITEDDVSFLERYISEPTDEAKARAENLCTLDAVLPWRIIAITFTNKAAGELKERLKAIPGLAGEDVWAMTFHSACARILRRDIDKLGYDKQFAIYDSTDTLALMKRILKDLDVDERVLAPKSVLNAIGKAKDALILPEEFEKSAENSADFRKKIIAAAYKEYMQRMKNANALDFDDLIMMTVLLFMQDTSVLEHYQKQFKHVLIDEYQDSNNLQYLFASMLSKLHGNICVVGDDDQSIYKFRGATIKNILSFENQYKDAKVLRLEQNYRSTEYILDAASDVISNNKGRKGKKLWTENGKGEKPSLHIVDNEREEAQFVADALIASRGEGRSWSQHAILYRMNAQSNQFEAAFKRAAIPYQIYGGIGFFDRAEVKDMLAYLCVIYNPHDDVRLLRIINTPTRGIGATTVARLYEIATGQGQSVYETIRNAKAHEAISNAAAKLSSFADLIDEMRELSEIMALDELYEELLRKTEYVKKLEEKKNDENLTKIENVRELKSNILSFMKENDGTLYDFLSETALYTDLDRDNSDYDKVLMMTIHSAKGLEFDTVFIVGAEDGIFPSSRAIGEAEEMEEERRLCYVGMTRAKRLLYFTAARRRMLFGKTAASQHSRFIREIDRSNIDINESSIAGYDFDTPENFGRSNDIADSFYDNYMPVKPNERPAVERTVKQSTAPISQSLSLKAGMQINHKTFGKGKIVTAIAAGNDLLMEIAFEEGGTKRMLRNSVVRYIEVID